MEKKSQVGGILEKAIAELRANGNEQKASLVLKNSVLGSIRSPFEVPSEDTVLIQKLDNIAKRLYSKVEELKALGNKSIIELEPILNDLYELVHGTRKASGKKSRKKTGARRKCQ